ncbi:PREDICTED: eukaryotic translation initiation factor 5B partial [Prunus dulcis]|uniref:PREDICTED: eukaryotic translation initiation factor 5B partial n=1 Tax=Prunus dulcis TaxID=3755 RepID=A0A5E4G1N3_PRUDU|nr:PREDICTED: eukaryotic translation initiation factor 5B partial [Prunus dulcis]
MPLAEPLKLKKADEAATTREAYLQVTGKLQIKGALYVTTLPKKSRAPDQLKAILIPDDEKEEEAKQEEPGAQLEVADLDELPKKMLREQAGQAFQF